MSKRALVVVSDLDDAKHGEINVLESAEKAARLVETLLEAGFDQQRIRVFSGDEMEMHVTHRPVVALASSDLRVERSLEEGMEEPPPAPEEEPQREKALPKAKAEVQPAAAEPFVKDGVRFSSQFRPA